MQGNDNYVGIAARDTANALRVLTSAVRGVAANSKDRQEQNLIIDSARDIIAKSNELLEVARNAIDNPNDPENQQKLQQVSQYGFVSTPKQVQNLDLSYKTDLDFGDCFQRQKKHLLAQLLQLSYIFWSFWRGKCPHLIAEQMWYDTNYGHTTEELVSGTIEDLP